MEFEERLGVKIDISIPEEDRDRLYERWGYWREGVAEHHLTPEGSNLLTRYEHFALGSSIGLPPDPFKPLAAQHGEADLGAIIEARRRELPPGGEYQGLVYAKFVPNLQSLIGLKPGDCFLSAERPDIDQDGRIAIPRIVGAYTIDGKKLDLSDDVMDQLQLPTSRDDLELGSGTIVREVFDFESGYRIELVSVPK